MAPECSKIARAYCSGSNFYRLLLSFFFCLLCRPVLSQLSADAVVSLITVGPSQEVYSAFGHSALRITDSRSGTDRVYNYGTFRFDNRFYINFARGENNYWLSVSPFSQEYYGWTIAENRSIIQQSLNLTLKQKNDLYRFLEQNTEPQYAVYRYDYFYDNCSNRIDNALINVFGNSLKLFPENVVRHHHTQGASIRQLTQTCLLNNPWGELGIETCLGIEMDKKISPDQFKFLPEYLMWNYDEARIRSANGTFVPLVKEKTILFKPRASAPGKTIVDYLQPLLCSSFILVLGVIVSFPKMNRTLFARLFDFSLFFICGLVGCLLVYLWFFTSHYSQCNMNLVWANPAGIFLSFYVFYRKQNTGMIRYHLYYGLLLLLAVLCWPFLPQQLNSAYFPVCLVLILRCFALFYYSKMPAGTGSSDPVTEDAAG
jgi:hypothetical protein